MLMSYEKPAVFMPFILNVVKAQLRRDKMNNAGRFPDRDCFRPPRQFDKGLIQISRKTTTEEPVWKLLLQKLEGELASRQTTTTTEAPIWKLLLNRLNKEQRYAVSTPSYAVTTTAGWWATTQKPSPTPPWMKKVRPPTTEDITRKYMVPQEPTQATKWYVGMGKTTESTSTARSETSIKSFNETLSTTESFVTSPKPATTSSFNEKSSTTALTSTIPAPTSTESAIRTLSTTESVTLSPLSSTSGSFTEAVSTTQKLLSTVRNYDESTSSFVTTTDLETTTPLLISSTYDLPPNITETLLMATTAQTESISTERSTEKSTVLTDVTTNTSLPISSTEVIPAVHTTEASEGNTESAMSTVNSSNVSEATTSYSTNFKGDNPQNNSTTDRASFRNTLETYSVLGNMVLNNISEQFNISEGSNETVSVETGYTSEKQENDTLNVVVENAEDVISISSIKTQSDLVITDITHDHRNISVNGSETLTNFTDKDSSTFLNVSKITLTLDVQTTTLDNFTEKIESETPRPIPVKPMVDDAEIDTNNATNGIKLNELYINGSNGAENRTQTSILKFTVTESPILNTVTDTITNQNTSAKESQIITSDVMYNAVDLSNMDAIISQIIGRRDMSNNQEIVGNKMSLSLNDTIDTERTVNVNETKLANQISLYSLFPNQTGPLSVGVNRTAININESYSLENVISPTVAILPKSTTTTATPTSTRHVQGISKMPTLSPRVIHSDSVSPTVTRQPVLIPPRTAFGGFTRGQTASVTPSPWWRQSVFSQTEPPFSLDTLFGFTDPLAQNQNIWGSQSTQAFNWDSMFGPVLPTIAPPAYDSLFPVLNNISPQIKATTAPHVLLNSVSKQETRPTSPTILIAQTKKLNNDSTSESQYSSPTYSANTVKQTDDKTLVTSEVKKSIGIPIKLPMDYMYPTSKTVVRQGISGLSNIAVYSNIQPKESARNINVNLVSRTTDFNTAPTPVVISPAITDVSKAASTNKPIPSYTSIPLNSNFSVTVPNTTAIPPSIKDEDKITTEFVVSSQATGEVSVETFDSVADAATDSKVISTPNTVTSTSTEIASLIATSEVQSKTFATEIQHILEDEKTTPAADFTAPEKLLESSSVTTDFLTTPVTVALTLSTQTTEVPKVSTADVETTFQQSVTNTPSTFAPDLPVTSYETTSQKLFAEASNADARTIHSLEVPTTKLNEAFSSSTEIVSSERVTTTLRGTTEAESKSQSPSALPFVSTTQSSFDIGDSQTSKEFATTLRNSPVSSKTEVGSIQVIENAPVTDNRLTIHPTSKMLIPPTTKSSFDDESGQTVQTTQRPITTSTIKPLTHTKQTLETTGEKVNWWDRPFKMTTWFTDSKDGKNGKPGSTIPTNNTWGGVHHDTANGKRDKANAVTTESWMDGPGRGHVPSTDKIGSWWDIVNGVTDPTMVASDIPVTLNIIPTTTPAGDLQECIKAQDSTGK